MAYLPGYGQVDTTDFAQSSPLEQLYSPRLFGAPPQLSSLCDMRIDSGNGSQEGATGDWYRNNVLKPAQVANFFVGRALFTGGYNTFIDIIRQLKTYSMALQRYNIYGNSGSEVVGARSTAAAAIQQAEEMEKYQAQKSTESTPSETASEQSTTASTETTSNTDTVSATDTGSFWDKVGTGQVGNAIAENFEEGGGDKMVSAVQSISDFANNLSSQVNGLMNGDTEVDVAANNTIPLKKFAEIAGRINGAARDGLGINSDTYVLDVTALDGYGDNADAAMNSMSAQFGQDAGYLLAAFQSSLSIGQPFYTFDADWYTYINNVKMMINTAVVMLGLQKAKVRIGDQLYPIGMDVQYNKDTDVWTNYRYITPDLTNGKGVGTTTSIDNMAGESNQYVSFMIDPVSSSESFSNSTKDSKIYGVMNGGNELGSEIAFIANSSANVVDDAIIHLAGNAIGAAEQVLNTLTFGAGKFTAAIAGSFLRSYMGDHPVYPKIFDAHTSTTSMSVNVKLRASRGDPYTYLIDVLVPLFHIMGMVLPKMSQFNAAAYQYPPIIQCQIPGIWGTRLGIISSVSISKNPDQSALSVNGYPMSINVTIQIEDLCHTLVTTGMNEAAYFLNNRTMFDYIAQCTGVDKYRSNSAARLVTRLALAASYVNNGFYNLGQAMANDITTLANKHTRISQQ